MDQRRAAPEHNRVRPRRPGGSAVAGDRSRRADRDGPPGLPGPRGLREDNRRSSAAQQRRQVRELGRRLLYVAGPEEVKVNRQPLWADDPEMLVGELEESSEGCRWLLEPWADYRKLLDRKAKWDEAVLIRFIHLQNVVDYRRGGR